MLWENSAAAAGVAAVLARSFLTNFSNTSKWFLGTPETINVIDAHKIDTAIYILVSYIIRTMVNVQTALPSEHPN